MTGSKRLILLALFTDAFKINMFFRYEMTVDFLVDDKLFLNREMIDINIIQRAALTALEVAVKRDVRVIAHFIVLDGNRGDKAFFSKGLERIVDGRPGERWNVFNDIRVDHIRGGMNMVVHQVFVNPEPVV
jgi:hypothetical protein